MSVIKPALGSERTTQVKRSAVIKTRGFFSTRSTGLQTVALPDDDPYELVDWKPGEVITAERLNATDKQADKNADAIKELEKSMPTALPFSSIDTIF